MAFYFDQLYIQALMTNKKKKSPKQQPTEIQMASNPDIEVITGIKLKHLSVKGNEYDSNHFFAVLDETPLKELVELKDMKNLFGNLMVNIT